MAIKTTSNPTQLLPGVSLIGDEVKKAMEPVIRQIAGLIRTSLNDPVLHLEPENALMWSTRQYETVGVFDLVLVNSGTEDVDTIQVQQDYFVAERGEDLILKNLSGISVVSRIPHLKSEGRAPVRLDFRPYNVLAKDLMINFAGPSLLGVKVLVRFRWVEDGKEFTITRGYGALNPLAHAIYGSDTNLDRKMTTKAINGVLVVSDGANYFTDSLNPGDPVAIPPHGKLRLSDIELYFGLPGHWVSLIHEIGVDANGEQIHKYY